MADPLVINPDLTLPADELRWTAVRASGPGGQNVNKVSTKVELRFDARRSTALDELVKARLLAIAGSRADGEGVIILVCQETRDQRRNLDLARERLTSMVKAALVRPKKRRPTRPSRGARERRIGEKKKQGEKKKTRAAVSE